MEETVKCPKCGGTTFSLLSNGKAQCSRCGNVFYLPQKEVVSESKSTESQEEVVVNAQNDAYDDYHKELDEKRKQMNKQRIRFLILIAIVVIMLEVIMTLIGC